MNTCYVHDQPVPPELLAELTDSAPVLLSGAAHEAAAELNRRMADEGYLFFRGVLPQAEVLAARQEVLERLVAVGEIHPPAAEAIFTGESRRRKVAGDLGAFWQSVSEGAALRRVSHGAPLAAVMQAIYEEPARGHDYLFLRVGPVGRRTDLHYDFPFFAQGTSRVQTVWFPLGDVPAIEGPLMIVSGSNKFSDLIDQNQSLDYNARSAPRVALEDDAIALARKRGVRLLTTDFRAGDVVVFGMQTLHGALDNRSPVGRVRVSCDVRYQRASDPIDERYIGPNPRGTTGVGYGELNGAKPLTEPWHVR